MSTITKEWLQQKIADMEAARDEIPFGLDEDDSNTLAALRIALASLEAEAVAYIIQDADARSRGEKGILRYFANISDEDINEYQITVTPLYTAPPAPVSVPDELADAVNGLLDAMDEYPESLVPINRDSAVVRQLRAAMLQGAENAESPTTMQAAPALGSSPKIAESPRGNSQVIADGWVMVPKEPTEVMFNAGKLAAGPTKQPDTASLVYKAMIDSSPDYKVGRETAFTGYEVQENVKDYVRRKIHTAFDVEKAVLWILKNSKYPEPDLWVFDIKVQFVDGPLILTDKSVTVVHSTLCKCSPPVGNVQFIECTLPAEWEGKVNAIDCVFKAEPQQEVK